MPFSNKTIIFLLATTIAAAQSDPPSDTPSFAPRLSDPPSDAPSYGGSDAPSNIQSFWKSDIPSDMPSGISSQAGSRQGRGTGDDVGFGEEAVDYPLIEDNGRFGDKLWLRAKSIGDDWLIIGPDDTACMMSSFCGGPPFGFFSQCVGLVFYDLWKLTAKEFTEKCPTPASEVYDGVLDPNTGFTVIYAVDVPEVGRLMIGPGSYCSMEPYCAEASDYEDCRQATMRHMWGLTRVSGNFPSHCSSDSNHPSRQLSVDATHAHHKDPIRAYLGKKNRKTQLLNDLESILGEEDPIRPLPDQKAKQAPALRGVADK